MTKNAVKGFVFKVQHRAQTLRPGLATRTPVLESNGTIFSNPTHPTDAESRTVVHWGSRVDSRVKGFIKLSEYCCMACLSFIVVIAACVRAVTALHNFALSCGRVTRS